jgi:gamma-glutamyltranspeptidase
MDLTGKFDIYKVHNLPVPSVNGAMIHKLLRLIGKIGFLNSQKSIKGFVHLLTPSLSNKEYLVLSLLTAK